MPSAMSSAASDEFHQKEVAATNSTIFDNFGANFNFGNGGGGGLPSELQQLLLRSFAMNTGAANGGGGFGANSNLGSANSMLAYAQQIAAVATVAQQFVAAASATSTAHAGGSKSASSASTPRKATSKKTSPKANGAESSPQKRDKAQKVSAAKHAAKFFGAVKQEPSTAAEAETKTIGLPSTTVNNLWTNLTSATSTVCGLPADTKTLDALELSGPSLIPQSSDRSSANAPDFVPSALAATPSEAPRADGAAAAALPRECELAERKRPAAIQELLQMKRARLSNHTSGASGAAANDSPPRFSPVTSAGDSNVSLKMEMTDENEFCKKEDTVENDAQTSLENHGGGAFESQWCNGREDDTETTSSYGNNDYCNTEQADIQQQQQRQQEQQQQPQQQQPQQQVPQLLLSEAVEEGLSDPASRAVADLLATLNAGGAGMQYLKAIQVHLWNCPLSRLNGGANSPSAAVKNSSTPPKSSPNRLPARTNDNDVCESALSSLVPHDRVFAQVPGRLSLLSNVVKYKMSVGEVKRRLMGPESFNFSLLGALLRRAKMPEKSQMLVDELNQVGLSIPRGRRRLSQVTLLSALTESESVQFARDFQRVAEAEFPAVPLAELSARRALAQCTSANFNAAVENRVGQLAATLDLAREFVELLDEDRSPVMDSNPEPVFERNIQDPLSTFSMLTHGFGTPAIRAGIKMLIAFLDSQQQFLRNQQQHYPLQQQQQCHQRAPF